MNPDIAASIKLVVAGIILLGLLYLASLCFCIHDLMYLQKVAVGNQVPESDHDFFVQKNTTFNKVSPICHLIYLLSFLFWFYTAYNSVYHREKEQAPYKPGWVPFSFLIPIFNLYGPYQIMRFIWWGNARSVDHLNKGYRTIRFWWALTIGAALGSRVYAYWSTKAVHADAFIQLTYLGMVVNILMLISLYVTYRLVLSSRKADSD